MSDETDPDRGLSPAEVRALSLVRSLQADPPRSGTELVPRVMRAARWQGALRGALRGVGAVLGALGGALGGLFSGHRSRPSR